MITHKLLKSNNVVHGFFSANGGVSKSPYKSLNCSFDNGDIYENVIKNNQIVKDNLNLKKLVQIKQIHSEKAIILKTLDKEKNIVADGIVTKLKNVGLCILTADCAPILFFDKKNLIIGACHAGWKGALNGIIKSTILKMEILGSTKNNICAVVGPTIQKNSYEVGNDVFNLIKKSDVFKKNEKIVQYISNEKYFFDLPLFIKEKLFLIGIDKIGDVHLDTYENKTFFSYRRTTHERTKINLQNKIDNTGRQISIIGLI